MFLIISIRIQKQKMKIHMVVMYTPQINIMFTIMTWNVLTRQLFYHYKIFTFILMLSSLFWAYLQNVEISLLKRKTIRWTKLHHHQNVISKHLFCSNVYQRKPIYVSIEAHLKKTIHDQNKKTSVFQIQVGYMAHPMLKI